VDEAGIAQDDRILIRASRTAYQACRDVRTCTVRITMAKVRDAISGILDGLTLADMAAIGEPADVIPKKKAAVRRARSSTAPSVAGHTNR